MRANSAPDDVRLSFDLLLAILEGCTTVIGPGHFEDAISAFDTFDAKTFSKGTPRPEVFNELLYRFSEMPLLVGRES
jgi:hypothetical protein